MGCGGHGYRGDTRHLAHGWRDDLRGARGGVGELWVGGGGALGYLAALRVVGVGHQGAAGGDVVVLGAPETTGSTRNSHCRMGQTDLSS